MKVYVIKAYDKRMEYTIQSICASNEIAERRIRELSVQQEAYGLNFSIAEYEVEE